MLLVQTGSTRLHLNTFIFLVFDLLFFLVFMMLLIFFILICLNLATRIGDVVLILEGLELGDIGGLMAFRLVALVVNCAFLIFGLGFFNYSHLWILCFVVHIFLLLLHWLLFFGDLLGRIWLVLLLFLVLAVLILVEKGLSLDCKAIQQFQVNQGPQQIVYLFFFMQIYL